jgi:hypothetical protein
LKKITSKKSLVNVLGVVYVHTQTSDGGDLYLTRFAQHYQKHFRIKNWYEKVWFNKTRIRLKGTSSVYRVPTRKVEGKSLDLVVKNCRVGEDVPINTNTLQEFCDAEFNSPWEEFSLVMEMREGYYGPREMKVKTQHPMAIYVPPERMQLWQSGRSRSKINRIRAKHPGIDLDILKQYKLIYGWIRGKNLVEVFENADVDDAEFVHFHKTINHKVISNLNGKGYMMADMKPEHIIISEADIERIEEIGREGDGGASGEQMEMVYQLIDDGKYSVVDYELLFRTPDHEDEVMYSRRHYYLDDQRDRFEPTPLPSHLSSMEIFNVPYIYGHAESTGGHLWVVGRNARLFDYFLPERWRKTPSFKLSDKKEVFYTITKDNIHLVWKTSRVGEMPEKEEDGSANPKIRKFGINSPFEEFAIAHELNRLGVPSVYMRAIYMTGGPKLEASGDPRKYELHRDIHEGGLYTPIDLAKAIRKGIIDESQCKGFLKSVMERLRNAGYDGSLLKANDLLLALDDEGGIMKNRSGEPEVIICNLE